MGNAEDCRSPIGISAINRFARRNHAIHISGRSRSARCFGVVKESPLESSVISWDLSQPTRGGSAGQFIKCQYLTGRNGGPAADNGHRDEQHESKTSSMDAAGWIRYRNHNTHLCADTVFNMLICVKAQQKLGKREARLDQTGLASIAYLNLRSSESICGSILLGGLHA